MLALVFLPPFKSLPSSLFDPCFCLPLLRLLFRLLRMGQERDCWGGRPAPVVPHRVPLPMGRPRPPRKPLLSVPRTIPGSHPPSVWIPDTLFWGFHFCFHSSVLDLLSSPINKQTNNTKPFFTRHFLPVTIWILCSHCSKGFQIRYSQLPSLLSLLLFSLQPTGVPNETTPVKVPSKSCFSASGPLCLPHNLISPYNIIDSLEGCSLHPL